MTNTKNEHVFPKEDGWIVRREGSKKISILSENKKDAMEYAGIIALNDGGSVVTHKYNGQFKNFKHGNEIPVRTHKIAPIITGTIEMTSPIVNNIDPIIQTMILI
jgi:hypothetical protein